VTILVVVQKKLEIW